MLESRSLHHNPLGKCEKCLDIPVSEALEERIITMASLNGMSKAEYARRILERAMYGEFSIVQSLADDPVFRNGRNVG